MPGYAPFHLRHITRIKEPLPSDWPDGEVKERWYPLYLLLKSPLFTELDVARLIMVKARLKAAWASGARWG